MPVAFTPIPTILWETVSTTEVVDSILILVWIKGRISKPVLLQGAEVTLIGIGCSISSGEGGGGK